MFDPKIFASLRHWVEPAHPELVKRHDDLFTIYTGIKQQLQRNIDAAFDRVSRQIGFVVTTTLPAQLEANQDGSITRFGLLGENLQGTLFENVFAEVLKPDLPVKGIAAGNYRLYLIWSEALLLRLRTDWMEPAHIFQLGSLIGRQDVQTGRIRPEVMEPPHWFDPGIALEVEERLIITVLDEVYPELKLVDRLTTVREALRRPVGPGVKEPAHFRLPERERE